MKEFRTQHNGKGKTHLLNDDLKTLCGCNGGDFSPSERLVIDNGKFFLKDSLTQEISKDYLSVEFCNRCVKIITKK
jgi:hypothetical protein